MAKLKKKDATIKQFHEETYKEWLEAMQGVDPDDHLSYKDWLAEFPKELRKEWGIYRDESTDEWRYNETNSNWEGDDLCEGCGCYYKAEETETDFCKICNEDFD
jgi:hypothetical protein